MNKNIIPTASVVLATLLAVPSYAATINTRFEGRPATPAEWADGVPSAFTLVYNYFLDTDADILSIGEVNVTFEVYNHPLGSDTAPPDPASVAAYPALGVDSFITTPGETAVSGDGGFNTNSTFFDSTDDGPVTNFHFARLTTNTFGVFHFVVSVAGSTGPEVFQFSVPTYIPEPTAASLLLTASMFVVGCRRRYR